MVTGTISGLLEVIGQGNDVLYGDSSGKPEIVPVTPESTESAMNLQK